MLRVTHSEPGLPMGEPHILTIPEYNEPRRQLVLEHIVDKAHFETAKFPFGTTKQLLGV